MGKLDGEVAVVTGASSGIGRATARLLAAEGAAVVLVARREKLLQEIEEEISSHGARATCYPRDVADPQAVRGLFSSVKEQFGRLDILVNGAGIDPPRRRLADARLEDWTRVIEVNLTGAYLCVQGALPLMRERGSGTIVNISSMAGKRTSISAGVAYCASKHGLGSLTRSINLEERRRGIRACEVCPGEVNTPILDTRPYPPPLDSRAYMLQPEDIAQAVLFVVTLPPRAMVEELLITPTTPRQRSSEELRTLRA
jgi:NAD(P)-dependent dehydrogenase (short-subunit alcohol dehydrogenase family)